LSYLEDRVADPVPITDAYLVIGQPIDGEVFAKLAGLEVVAAKIRLPVSIGLQLINHDCALLSTMATKVSLPIAVQVEPARHDSAADRVFPDCGTNHPALPFHITRQTDINRHQHVLFSAQPSPPLP
jgi:hypothetical protein